MSQPVRPNTMHGTNANNSFQNNNLINTVYDPTKQNNPPYKTIYQPTPTQTPTLKTNIFSPPSNTSQKQYDTKTKANASVPGSSQYADRVDSNVRQQGLPTHPNMINNSQQDKMNNILAEKISDKIYNHFKIKYPTTIDASGFNNSTIETIVKQSMKKQPLNEKGISKIIDIIDHKFKN
jgi:hypothetical protein